MTETMRIAGEQSDRCAVTTSRNLPRRLTLACLSALVAASSSAEAQVARSLDDLVRAGELRRGIGVYVTDTSGRRLKGTITDVAPTLVTITKWQDTWTLASTEVRKIELQDPLENGFSRGFVYGALVLYGGCFSPLRTEVVCGTGSDSTGLAFLDTFVSGLPYVAVGMIGGGLIDWLTHTTLYERSGFARLTFSPTLSLGRAGARLSFGW